MRGAHLLQHAHHLVRRKPLVPVQVGGGKQPGRRLQGALLHGAVCDGGGFTA